MITAISRTMVLETRIQIPHRLAPWSSARKDDLRRTARKSSSSPFSQKHDRYSRKSGIVVVEAMRIPSILPVTRPLQLGTAQHAGQRSFQSTASSTSERLYKPSLLQSTRLFSVSANENNNSEIKHQEGPNHSSVQHLQDELSKLAKSVRDKVTSLLLSTTTMGREIDSSLQILIPIVVSVSGGCDSVALFYALVEWKEELQKQQSLQYQQQNGENRDKSLLLQLDITVVHFHHRQRPIEADEDCRLVRELVESHNHNNNAESDDCVDNPISFRLEDWNDQTTIDSERTATSDDGEEGEASTSFSQDRARVWRRNRLRVCAEKRLSSLAREHQTGIATKECSSSSNVGDTTASISTKRIPFGIVLTAHHDDDSYETVLIKLLRGVHLLNLHDRATIASIARMEGNVQSRRGDDASNETAHLLPSLENEHEKSEKNQKEKCAIPPIYLVRPFVTDSATLPDAVMPGHTKEELVQYLVDRGLSWREDASNHDPNSKYLRNRVRNELIPLLKDLTDDSFRNKRVPALLEQSRELNEDLEPRVEEYLDRVVVQKESASFFSILPPSHGTDFDSNSNSNSNSRLVQSQALYQWVSACAAAQESSSLPFSISYESLQRVVQQLDQHPQRKTWKLELGLGWNVERTGDFLRMAYDGSDDKSFDSTMEGERGSGGSYQIWEWTRVSQKDNRGEESTSQKENENLLRIQIPSSMLESSIKFVSMTLKEAEVNQIARASDDTVPSPSSLPSLRFSPPWRNSSVKLRAFLRGQKVPAHLRDDTQLLVLIEKEAVTTTTTDSADEEEEHSRNSSFYPNRLVALQVGDTWMVDKEFHIVTSTESGNETILGENQESPIAVLGGKIILQLERRKDE